MSFSTDVKKELCSAEYSASALEAECYGILLLCRSFSFSKILLQTGSKEAAEHFILLLRRAFDVTATLEEGGKTIPTYRVSIENEADIKRILYRLGYQKGLAEGIMTDRLKAEGSLKAFARGAFLAGGSVSDPEREYRIDFSFRSEETAKQFSTLLAAKGIKLSLGERAGKFILYTKNSGIIEDLLTFMGAGGETLNLIGVKIYKNVRNKLNRQNNCETSNILKTANAAFVQRTAIEKLEKSGKLATLPGELAEIARLRLDNPEMPLSQLCKLSKTKLTRSGFNHRMQKLLEIAKE